jgi:hypothetical protein
MMETEAGVGVMAIFDVVGQHGGVRAALLEDGALVRVSAQDPMAVWPLLHTRHLVVEEYAAPPAEMLLRVHTACGRTLRLRGEVTADTLIELLQLESSLAIG